MSLPNLPEPRSESDRRLLSLIHEHGWAVIGIPADDEGATYSFTVGLTHAFKHPELLITGLPIEETRDLLNRMGAFVRGGGRFGPDTTSEQVIEGQIVHLKPVLPRYYREFLGSAVWLHRGIDFDVIQAIWPDKYEVYPWEDGLDPKLAGAQPVLCEVEGWPYGWPFMDPPNLGTFVGRKILEKQPLYTATHDHNNDWQFMAEADTDPSDGQYMGFADVVRRFPEITELATMPGKTRATRKGDTWIKQRLE